jgi:hypothetical protein
VEASSFCQSFNHKTTTTRTASGEIRAIQNCPLATAGCFQPEDAEHKVDDHRDEFPHPYVVQQLRQEHGPFTMRLRVPAMRSWLAASRLSMYSRVTPALLLEPPD